MRKLKIEIIHPGLRGHLTHAGKKTIKFWGAKGSIRKGDVRQDFFTKEVFKVLGVEKKKAVIFPEEA
jgi:hypothetical protein|tara:strand:- start:45 stop:245 length:201 start_codon:yes stop_codon:yes gene_type:complete